MKGLELRLPAWTAGEAERDRRYPGDRKKMEVAVRLAELNIRHGTGGPFGAAVFEEPGGRLISIGVNAVLANRSSLAHAEIMALGFAERRLRIHRLNERSGRTYVLASSAQPCAMCLGAILWAGVQTVLFAATKADVEALTGFDEGPLPKNWKQEFERRRISIRAGILRREACRALRAYREQGGLCY